MFDIGNVGACSLPRKITICSGVIVDAVKIEFDDKTSVRIGGVGGAQHPFELAEDEVVTEIRGKYGSFEGVSAVSYLSFSTNKGRTLESNNGCNDKMDFIISGKTLYNIRGVESLSPNRYSVYLKSITADELKTDSFEKLFQI